MKNILLIISCIIAISGCVTVESQEVSIKGGIVPHHLLVEDLIDDFYGNLRPQFDDYDIGAYEYTFPPPTGLVVIE